MSEAADAFENGIMLLFFNATTFDNIAENDTTGPASAFYLSGHTSSPGDDGDQTTNELAYTSYARASVARTSGGFTVTGGVANLTSAVSLPAGTGGSGTLTHMGLGLAASAAGTLYMYGAASPNVVCGDGVTPQFTPSTTFTLA